jgi:mannose-1-phosphate guanylyltransferase
MIAVILIGGMGTRLRPLTCDTPKPLLPVVNRPFLEYQFDVLKAHGIREIVLCTSYKPEVFRKALGDGRRLGLKIRYVHEPHPLGTGGALKNAQAFVQDTALVLNGDILNALDVTKFVKQHRSKRADVSIALTRVKDPTAYGLVETDGDGRVEKFLEKPSWDEIETNTVNAGAYLFEPKILDLIPPGIHHSLERALFPQLLQNKAKLFGYVTTGYWIDIGSVEKYLQIHFDILRGQAFARKADGIAFAKGVRRGKELTLEPAGGRIAVGAGSSLGDFVRLTGPVCVGPGCKIGKGAALENCVVLEGTTIGEGATLKGCVVGSDCVIGANSTISAKTALGARSRIEAFSAL